MTNSFTRKLDRLHQQQVIDPENMSEVDRLMLEMEQMARDYLARRETPLEVEVTSTKEAHVAIPSDADAAVATPAAAANSAPDGGGAATALESRPLPAGTAPTEPSPPSIAPVETSPDPWPRPIAVADGLCRWVPRHEADAMRAQDMRGYRRRLAEQERRRYLGWD